MIDSHYSGPNSSGPIEKSVQCLIVSLYPAVALTYSTDIL